MPKHCPWCCEPLESATGDACPHCGRGLVDETGRELRPIDVRYSMVEAAQCERFRRLLTIGVPAVAVIALAMPMLHLGAVALSPVLAVIHLVIVRWYLTGEAYRLLGATRRQFNRWLTRFAFLWFALPGYAAMVTPVAGIVVGAVTFAGLTTAAHRYSLWGLARERDRLPLLRWEKTLLIILAVATLVALVFVGAVTALLGWSVAALIGWLAANSG